MRGPAAAGGGFTVADSELSLLLLLFVCARSLLVADALERCAGADAGKAFYLLDQPVAY
jgi:hypothetical protein